MKIYIGRYPTYHKNKPEPKERKISIRIDKWDTWNLDHTLALIIHPMLIQLKAAQHGAPLTDDVDVPDHLKSTAAPPKKEEWDTDENFFLRWNWIMDEMIWAFGQAIDDEGDMQFYKKKGKPDYEGLEAWDARKRNGFRLFGKYYQGLWD